MMIVVRLLQAAARDSSARRNLGSQSGPSGRLGTKFSHAKKHPLDRIVTALARVSIVFRKRSRCPPLPPAHADQVAGG